MTLTWKIKPFETLSATELYEILRLRSEVFVVEQNCVYQDVDGRDVQAVHVFGEFEGKVVAYARIFDKGFPYETASIGRVIVKQTARDQKLGRILMEKAIAAVAERFLQTTITISAQLYLQKFYESLGFTATSEMYLEDDIPHIEMVKR
jgi:ElaA protein